MNTTRGSLLARLKDGEDSQDWREFDAIYRPLLRQYARAWGLQSSDAEEVAQECLVLFWRHLKKFDYDPKRGRFCAWLARIVERRVKNRARQRREAQADSRQLRELQGTPTQKALEDIWLQEHVRFYLQEIRREMKDTTYEAYRLYMIEQQPVAQVCEKLGMTPNQVHRIKWRVNQKLAEKLKSLEA